LPGSLPQIEDELPFPSLPCPSGWVFREIPRLFACLSLLSPLCALPVKQHFDHQFKPVLSMIKPKMKKTYDVYSGIQIKVSSAVEDLSDIIEAYEADDGKRYLKIRMDNDTTFRTFERREGR